MANKLNFALAIAKYAINNKKKRKIIKKFSNDIIKLLLISKQIIRCNKKHCSKELKAFYEKKNIYIHKLNSLSKNKLKNNIDLIKLYGKINKLKETKDLKKCSYEKCDKIHTKSLIIAKNMLKDLCNTTKLVNHCKAYKELYKIKKINFTFTKKINKLINMIS
tara:strand:+ start:15413 stop:15901 length:489 start_codon:yes stop_codon:yes gene_type:complete